MDNYIVTNQFNKNTYVIKANSEVEAKDKFFTWMGQNTDKESIDFFIDKAFDMGMEYGIEWFNGFYNVEATKSDADVIEIIQWD